MKQDYEIFDKLKAFFLQKIFSQGKHVNTKRWD